MKKKNKITGFENGGNEKQNSLASGIRISSSENFLTVKNRFVRINEGEYSTDFDFFFAKPGVYGTPH